MNILDQFKHQWKVYFKRGAGEAIVYGNTEAEAKVAALAAYRKKKTLVDFCTVEDVVATIEPIA